MNFKKIVILLSTIILIISCDIDETTGTGSELSEYQGVLFINEFLASNTAANFDEDGNYGDWFEIYNSGPTAIDIGNFKVWDSGTSAIKYSLPSTTIDAGGFLLIWCDDAGTGLHTNFKLSAGGDDIYFEDADANAIEHIAFTAQTTDISYGRNPDGGSTWQTFATPTPASSNTSEVENTAPVIVSVNREPLSPSPVDIVTITTLITDNSEVSTVSLFYKIGDGTYSDTVMTATTNADEYSGTIAAQTDSIVVSYFVKAIDDESVESFSDTSSYTVYASAYQPPTLFINEFMASNDAANSDENGEFEDWFEIYNASSEAVDIGGMYVTDKLGNINDYYQIPTTSPDSTTIAAGEFLLLYADEQTEQGILHMDIKLSGSGEQIGLYSTDATNNVPIDTLTYNRDVNGSIGFGIDTDKSCGRKPDGTNTWVIYETANITPGSTNN